MIHFEIQKIATLGLKSRPWSINSICINLRIFFAFCDLSRVVKFTIRISVFQVARRVSFFSKRSSVAIIIGLILSLLLSFTISERIKLIQTSENKERLKKLSTISI